MKTKDGVLGGICGQNSSTGNIERCIVSGKIINKSSGGATGGITSYSSGDIKNSINMCNINASTGSSENSTYSVGGICSSNASTTTIENCVNIGNINVVASSEGNIKNYYAGGIIGCLQNEGVIVNNCYNLGNISASGDEILSVGGIVGYILRSQIQHCYNIGHILKHLIMKLVILEQ